MLQTLKEKIAALKVLLQFLLLTVHMAWKTLELNDGRRRNSEHLKKLQHEELNQRSGSFLPVVPLCPVHTQLSKPLFFHRRRQGMKTETEL